MRSQTAPLFMGDSKSMTEFRAEVWGWIVQGASEFSASSMDVAGFRALSLEQQSDLAASYVRRLGVDGASMVSAQGALILTVLTTSH